MRCFDYLCSMKICFKCNQPRPLSEFYKHPKMEDGHLNKCKDCTKADSEARRLVKMQDPEWVAKEAERHRIKAMKAWNSGYRPTKEVKTKRMKTYNHKYPEKYKAKVASQRMCRGTGFHGHHWSYREEHWKDIIKMDSTDHLNLHRFLVYDQERMQYRRSDNSELLDTREAHENYIQEVLNKLKPTI